MTPSDSAVGYVPDLVADWVASTPAALAVASPEITLTYAELHQRAATVAGVLRAFGVGPDVIVGLCVDRSAALVVGALAIFKANGAYLAIDPTQPDDRIAYMVRNAGAAVILASPTMAPSLTRLGRPIVIIDTTRPAAGQALDAPAPHVTGSQLAYVVYTSGSTGLPKGVAVTHDGLRNLVQWHRRAFAITETDRATQMASPGFDAAVWEIWPYLASGASVHVADDVTRKSPALLRDWLVARQITVTFAVTQVAELLMDLDWPAGTPLRYLLTGGDMLARRPPAGLPFEVVNNYGPTESTVVATSGVVRPIPEAAGAPGIGRPIANVEAYVLDEDLRPVQAGEPGELYLGGAGLARGYLNDAVATARAFVPHPFSADRSARLYRTGDRVRMDTSGELAFLGRLDDQIKVNGHRIEPAEVARALTGHGAISATVVVAQDDGSGRKRLVAYVQPRPGAIPAGRALSDYLARHLPAYMIPSVFVLVEEFQITANGKIDRVALPPPTPDNMLGGGDRRARSEVQHRVASIVSSLLGLQEVDDHENFFLLGGHSLLGAQLIARLRDAFAVDVSLRCLFDAPTVAGLSAEIERLLDAEVAALSETEIRRLLDDEASWT